MSFSFPQLDPKTRRIFALGNICLWSGIVLDAFFHPSTHVSRIVQHAVAGFLIGFAIISILFTVLQARRSRKHRA